jgi:hypothetical protein
LLDQLLKISPDLAYHIRFDIVWYRFCHVKRRTACDKQTHLWHDSRFDSKDLEAATGFAPLLSLHIRSVQYQSHEIDVLTLGMVPHLVLPSSLFQPHSEQIRDTTHQFVLHENGNRNSPSPFSRLDQAFLNRSL